MTIKTYYCVTRHISDGLFSCTTATKNCGLLLLVQSASVQNVANTLLQFGVFFFFK